MSESSCTIRRAKQRLKKAAAIEHKLSRLATSPAAQYAGVILTLLLMAFAIKDRNWTAAGAWICAAYFECLYVHTKRQLQAAGCVCCTDSKMVEV